METPQLSFTCLTCCVGFKTADLQRDHYKTDWHRYNLKRKVSDLPPVKAEDFQQKVLNQRQIEQLSQQDKSVYCEICRKSFGNQNAFVNHLNSKKHKDNEKKCDGASIPVGEWVDEEEEEEAEEEEVTDIEEVSSDEWEEESENPIQNNDCIFCLHHSKNFLKNLDHMTTYHSFFIPDIEFCTNVYGLLVYLGEKIGHGCMCLWCNDKGRSFHTAEAARQHMVDKGHCRMLHEGQVLVEYVDFYDYSSSYPDAEEEPDPDEEVSVPEIDGSDFQLVLPSGAVIGHRSLMRYYRQNLNPNSAVVLKNSMSKVMCSYRALGWKENDKEATAKKARDVHYMKRMKARFNLKMGVKGNKFQKHFRPQVNF